MSDHMRFAGVGGSHDDLGKFDQLLGDCPLGILRELLEVHALDARDLLASLAGNRCAAGVAVL